MIANAGRRETFPAFVLLFASLYAGFGVMSPFLPTLLQARGLRPEDIGLALALNTIVRLVTGPVAPSRSSPPSAERRATKGWLPPRKSVVGHATRPGNSQGRAR
jgi:hypothetical protein